MSVDHHEKMSPSRSRFDRQNFEVTPAILLSAILCFLMTVPYLPGRFDESAAAFSLIVQASSFVSLLLVPVGLGWIVARHRIMLWHRLAVVSVGLLALVMVIAAASMNQMLIGMMIGIAATFLARKTRRQSRAHLEHLWQQVNPVACCFVCVPLILVTFRAAVLPRAADWSRESAIQHSSRLIAELESFRQRRGHYPISLQSLNRDVPTGVIGIERFHYEPNGGAYNLFFVRPHIELDAKEVVMFNPRDEHRFTSHELDILQYDGEPLNLRRGDGRRSRLPHPHWVSILFD
jgi:hypothetical protein